MQPHETEAALAAAADLIRATARRLARRRDFRGHDPEDLAQSLTLRLLARLPTFDPARTTLAAFVRKVLAQGVANLLRDRHAACRRDSADVSLDRLLAGSEEILYEMADDAYQRGERQQQQADLRADVAAFLASLDPADRALAEHLLRQGGVVGAARALGIQRGRVYAALRRWRARARQLGLGEESENGPTV